MLRTPVLFLVFNRPDTTRRVFEAIRQAQPRQLFIAADGPRPGRAGEAEKCAEVRDIATRVDWPCEVITLFRKQNLGCGRAVSEAITWFFEHVEAGIILEDDCLPEQSFFGFCEHMLERYRSEERVMHIGGNNFQFGRRRGDGSYYFSKYNHIWGWATWRSAWSNYRFEISEADARAYENKIILTHNDASEQAYWMTVLESVVRSKTDTWDYQWTLSCWFNDGISVVPNVNLVSNIGFGNDATHTTGVSILANLPTKGLEHFTDPKSMKVNRRADEYTNGKVFHIKNKIILKVKVRLANFIGAMVRG